MLLGHRRAIAELSRESSGPGMLIRTGVISQQGTSSCVADLRGAIRISLHAHLRQ